VSRLPPHRSADRQLYFDGLVDKELKHYSASTTFVGDFFEELTRKIWHGSKRFSVRAGCICPDIEYLGKLIECKAMRLVSGRQGHTLIYLHRIDAYDDYLRSIDKKLWYLFWVYKKLKASEFQYKEDLISALAKTEKEAFVFPSSIIHPLRDQLKIEIDKRFPAHKNKFIRVRYGDLDRLKVGCKGQMITTQYSPHSAYGRRCLGPKMFYMGGF